MTTINPFHNPQSAYSRREFKYDGHALFTHRGVSVYKNNADSWDYVFEGVTVCQRAGFNKARAVEIVDAMFSGDSCHSEPVCAHLRAHGHNPMSYAQYGVLWAAGKVA
jgi:hypothetical protein